MTSRNGIHELQRIEGVLAGLALCQGIGTQTIRQLAMQARILRAPRGHPVVRRGEHPAGVFAVVHGQVKLRLQAGGTDEVILKLLGPGETFGKAASLLGHPSIADIIALEDSLLIVIEPAALTAQMGRDTCLARNLANALAAKAQGIMAEFEHSMLPKSRRLAAYLDSIAERDAARQAWTARLPVTKTVLAARLGMKKETLSRLFAKLARLGVVQVGRRDIIILDRGRLAEVGSDPARGARA